MQISLTLIRVAPNSSQRQQRHTSMQHPVLRFLWLLEADQDTILQRKLTTDAVKFWYMCA